MVDFLIEKTEWQGPAKSNAKSSANYAAQFDRKIILNAGWLHQKHQI